MQLHSDDIDVQSLLQLRLGAPILRLTPRERQVAELVAEGLKNQSIGRRLSLSPATVATYVQRIQSRLGLSGRSEIATLTRERSTADLRGMLANGATIRIVSDPRGILRRSAEHLDMADIGETNRPVPAFATRPSGAHGLSP
jgi:DNA-binding CsgD family transcriptional regulator